MCFLSSSLAFLQETLLTATTATTARAVAATPATAATTAKATTAQQAATPGTATTAATAMATATATTAQTAETTTLDVMLLAKCELLVGQFTSNTFRGAFELRAADCGCVPVHTSLDSDWCFDWGLQEGFNPQTNASFWC